MHRIVFTTGCKKDKPTDGMPEELGYYDGDEGTVAPTDGIPD